MGKYSIELSSKAKKDLTLLYRSGNKVLINKLEKLLKELSEHPKTGTGKPEQLKGLDNTYSRRLDMKNRVVYTIIEQNVVVLVSSALGHYDDK